MNDIEKHHFFIVRGRQSGPFRKIYLTNLSNVHRGDEIIEKFALIIGEKPFVDRRDILKDWKFSYDIEEDGDHWSINDFVNLFRYYSDSDEDFPTIFASRRS